MSDLVGKSRSETKCLPSLKARVYQLQLKILYQARKEKLQAKHRGAGHRIPDEQCLKRKSAALQVTLVVLNHKDRISDLTATGLVGQAVLRELISGDPAEGHPTHDWGLESLCHLEGSRGLQLFFKILKRS